MSLAEDRHYLATWRQAAFERRQRFWAGLPPKTLAPAPRRDVLRLATPGFVFGVDAEAARGHRDWLRLDYTRPTVVAVQEAVCRFYGIHVDDILAHRRTNSLFRPRQVAMYLAKTMTLQSLPQIARRFDRDHTTVLHAVRKIERERGRDAELNQQINEIAATIAGRGA